MATRRNRIKGIANIPQRRKVENKTKEEEETLSITETAKHALEKPALVQESPPKPTAQNDVQQNITSDETEPPSNSTSQPAPSSKLPRRRTFIKPAVNPKLLSQKIKSKVETNTPEDGGFEKPTSVEPSAEVAGIECNTSDLGQELVNQQSVAPSTAKQLPQLEPVKLCSDAELPVGPLSPTKLINRSRIKAVPRLGQRRTSATLHGSASESEDDGRKNFKRIRTESVCSTQSLTNEPQVRSDPNSSQKSKEFSSVIQRKCKRTEQSRKMAEARRHFLHKFGNQTPDKQKLTMMDLIFYNPTTNPMCQQPKKQQSVEENEENENVDSPENVEENKQPEEAASVGSDEENAIPAPQIKIGADGEIIVDEKSLVIENIETKKGREELQKSRIVDGDFDTGYGIYKREKRSKDWTKEETLRFYKALNTLGCDFSLMTELFSGRSRRELKMKFKKEERINRLLVDRALTQPLQFDITGLRREVEEQQKRLQEEAERRSLKLTEKKPIPYYGQRKKSAVKVEPNRKPVIKPVKKKSRDIYSKVEKGIACVWESESEDETPLIKYRTELKATRSGRIPKLRKLHTDADSALVKKESVQDPEPTQEIQGNNFKDLNSLTPGSVMIVSSQTPTGEPTFKVFMVTPTQNKIPITLTQDMLNNLTQSPGNSDFGNPAIEGNISIPADVPISTESVEKEMCPYENTNISSIPVNDDMVLLGDNNVTLCSDGKYDVELSQAKEK